MNEEKWFITYRLRNTECVLKSIRQDVEFVAYVVRLIGYSGGQVLELRHVRLDGIHTLVDIDSFLTLDAMARG